MFVLLVVFSVPARETRRGEFRAAADLPAHAKPMENVPRVCDGAHAAPLARSRPSFDTMVRPDLARRPENLAEVA